MSLGGSLTGSRNIGRSGDGDRSNVGVYAGRRARYSGVGMQVIEKLRGRENYTTLAFAVKMTLIHEGFWGAVEPVVANLDAKSAEEAWDKLRNAFQDNGFTRKIGLLKQLTSIRLDNCRNVEAYADKLRSSAYKLSTIGFQVNDSWITALLSMGLSDQYESMIMGLKVSRAALTPHALKRRFIRIKPV